MWPFDKDNSCLITENERLRAQIKCLNRENEILREKYQIVNYIPKSERFDKWDELHSLRYENKSLHRDICRLQATLDSNSKQERELEKEFSRKVHEIECGAQRKIEKLEKEIGMYKDFFKGSEVKVFLKDKEVELNV